MTALLVAILQLGSMIPQAGHCVVDEAGILNPSDVAALESGCSGLEGRLFIAVPSSTRGQGDRYAVQLFRDWRVPTDGLLIMLAPNDRKWRIAVGDSLRSSISDARAADIGRAYGVPAFKQGLWGTGLISIEHMLTPLMTTAALSPPIAPVTRKTTTTTTTSKTRIAAPPPAPVIFSSSAPAPTVAPVVVEHHGLSGFWIFMIILLVVGLVYYVWRIIMLQADAADRVASRRPYVPVAKWGEEEMSSKVRASSSSAASASSPVSVNVSQQVVSPGASSYQRAPAYYPQPIVPIVVEEPVVYVKSPPVVEREVTTTTTTTVEESAAPAIGGAGGGWDSPSSSDNDVGGAGGGFDSSTTDSSSSIDMGGSGGDFSGPDGGAGGDF